MFIILLISGSALFFMNSCDSKDVVEHVAKSKYEALQNRYDALDLKYERADRENRELKEENTRLKQKVNKYTNGFKSMYE